MNSFLKAAKDPDCLVAISPYYGGSWWSCLRPAQPRDFSQGYQWKTLGAVLRTLPWTSDYHFSFKFTVPDDFKNGSYWIMYQSNGRIVFSLDKDARGCRFTFGSYSFTGGVTIYTPFTPSVAGTHSATLAVVGNTLRVTLDGTVYEQTGERVESSEYDRAVTTSAPVTLHSVSLTNDTTGADIWQAAYSELHAMYEPRNFFANPKLFTDSYTAQEEIGTDDFTLEVSFSFSEGTSIESYLRIGCLVAPMRVNRGVEVLVAAANTANQTIYLLPVGGDFITVPIRKITVVRRSEKIYATVYGKDGVVVKEGVVGLPSGHRIIPNISATNMDGTISAAFICNDTTGTTVWQAPHSDLYSTLPVSPWPSSTPRNFAEEPATWTDAMITANNIGKDNWAFEIRLNLKSQITGAVFNNIVGSPLKLYDDLVSSGEASFFLRNYVDTATWIGRHSIRLEVAAGNASLYLDGAFKATKATGLTSVQFEQSSTTSADVEIEAVEFVNLTTGRTVWSYPSEAERVRLLTLTNISTQNGFNAADSSQLARVDTALDLRGKVSSYTIIVDCELSETTPNVTKHEIAGQGPAVAFSEVPAICSLAGSSTSNIQLSQEIAGKRVIIYKKPEVLTSRHYIAGVVDVGTTTTRLALYLDGKLFIEQTFNGIPTGAAQSMATNFALFDNRNGAYTQKYAPIYSCLLFGRALSAAEIQALCYPV